ncbi:MAG: hypothetical protein HY291_22765, partial [Planctomycetes bacterium]|nr:hypothetical protein [Planctomycetota bacterium]
MRPTIAIPLLLLCLLWGAQRSGRCEFETPHKEGSFCRFKCPGPGMHFSEGLPVRVFIDGIDQGGWQSKRAKMEAQVVRVYLDGQLAATVDPQPEGYNYFETSLKDIKAGPHVLTAESTNFDKSISKSDPLPIVVDPSAKRDQNVDLKEDLMLKGSAHLAWENTVVKGNGFKVRSAPGWTGSVSVRGSFVSGLGSLTEPGIDVKTSGGSVNIEKSIFEATGAVFVQADGAGTMAVIDSEFRASNLIKFVASDPGKSPVFRASGSASGEKVFQGNRIGAGIVCFDNTGGWLIGGDRDEESNILNGPRCVIWLTNCKNSRVCGNLIRHDYHGGWSQGLNLACENCNSLVAEHNIIWHGSWPVQSFAGEFRYNLVVNSGHNWIRTLLTGSKVHHNLFIHVSHGGGINSGVWMYKDQKDVVLFNNTMDGGDTNFQAFNAPFIEI